MPLKLFLRGCWRSFSVTFFDDPDIVARLECDGVVRSNGRKKFFFRVFIFLLCCGLDTSMVDDEGNSVFIK